MEGPYRDNQGKLPGGGLIFLASELYQNGSIQTGFLIHRMTTVCRKGGTLPGTGGLLESRQDAQQELGLLIVGTPPPMGVQWESGRHSDSSASPRGQSAEAKPRCVLISS